MFFTQFPAEALASILPALEGRSFSYSAETEQLVVWGAPSPEINRVITMAAISFDDA